MSNKGLRGKSNIIDVGSNIGIFALWADKEYSDCNIFSYEPSPETFKFLKRNTCNKNNIRIFQKAVLSKKGRTKFFTSSNHGWNHLVAVKGHVDSSSSLIEVEAVTLEDIIESNGLDKVDLLKLDCEGGEFDILFNLTDSNIDKIDNIAMEYHDKATKYTHFDIINFLQGKKYEITFIKDVPKCYCGIIHATRFIKKKKTYFN